MAKENRYTAIGRRKRSVAKVTLTPGKGNITVNGKSYSVANNTNISLDSAKLAAGHYIVTAVVYENANYTMATATVEFDITKHAAKIDSVVVPSADVTEGQNVTITVRMNNVANGTVLVEGVNLVTKAQKANPMYGIQGGLNKVEKPLNASKNSFISIKLEAKDGVINIKLT